MNKQNLGKAGEDLAAAFLENKHFRIVERNYRAGRLELDLIAWSPEGILVFVEVKTRSSNNFGGPIDAVTDAKQHKMAKAAAHYMHRIDYEWIIRFDILAVHLLPGKTPEITHVEDAFFPIVR
ncbi:MAG: YraN family protein [Bacteroidetes bacterium]|nr:YraN family protein [Bacteroidota bacterium]